MKILPAFSTGWRAMEFVKKKMNNGHCISNKSTKLWTHQSIGCELRSLDNIQTGRKFEIETYQM